MRCVRRPPHSQAEQGVGLDGRCAACQSEVEDPWLPGPNWDLVPAGPLFEALAQAYRVADDRNRAALRYAYPNLGALIMTRRA